MNIIKLVGLIAATAFALAVPKSDKVTPVKLPGGGATVGVGYTDSKLLSDDGQTGDLTPVEWPGGGATVGVAGLPMLAVDLDHNSENKAAKPDRKINAIVIRNTFVPSLEESAANCLEYDCENNSQHAESVSTSETTLSIPITTEYFMQDTSNYSDEDCPSQNLTVGKDEYLDDTISIASCTFSTTSSDSEAYHELCEIKYRPDHPVPKVRIISHPTPTRSKRKIKDTVLVSSKRHNYETDSDDGVTIEPIDLKNNIPFPMVQRFLDNANRFEIPVDDSPCATQQTNSNVSSLIATEKIKAKMDFLKWKGTVVDFYSAPFTLLSLNVVVNLSTLDKGEYWFSADHIYFPNEAEKLDVDKSQLIGLIFSEGIDRDKYLVMNGKGRELLRDNYSYIVNETVSLRVFNGKMFGIYDIAKSPYTNVASGPEDLILPYSEDFIFIGEITNEMTFKVKILGDDHEFPIDHFGDTYQVFFVDQISKRQKCFPYKAVHLNVITETVALINFNYSFAIGLKDGSRMDAKILQKDIIAGINPVYF
ncbi:hypothetical protein HDV01_007094 [Terramyces sp. JEL0728]|nr:hypothetical protein HDV01_007094 [Terramyces sp. JEL0728]